MLLCNGVLVNTQNPKSELDKEVAARLKAIATQFKLAEGGTVLFVYPNALIKKDIDNPGKTVSPSGIKLSFKANEVLKDGTGVREWRYFTNRQSSGKDNSNVKYSPNYHIFDGRWELGLPQVEIIFFLLDIHPFTEGGKNYNSKVAPFIKRRDAKADAQNEVNARRERISIEARLYLSPEDGGFTETEIRDLAARLAIANPTKRDLNEIILEIDAKMKDNKGLVVMARESVKTPDANIEIKKTITLAREFELIKKAKDAKKKNRWVSIEPDGTLLSIVEIPIGTKDETMLLVNYLLKHPDYYEALKLKIEAKAEPETDNDNEEEPADKE